MQKVTSSGLRPSFAHDAPYPRRPSTRPSEPDLDHPSGPLRLQPSAEQGRAGADADAGSFTKLYIDVMRAAARRSDAWGPWAIMGESVRGLGLLAMVGAPVGLPCACIADVARMSRRWWRAWLQPDPTNPPQRI